DAALVLGEDRTSIRQGAADLVHGPRGADRRGPGRDASQRAARAISVRHPEGTAQSARAITAHEALAPSPYRGKSEASARGSRTLRVCREPGSHRQGT